MKRTARMVRAVALANVAVLAVSLSACGSTSSSAAGSTSSTTSGASAAAAASTPPAPAQSVGQVAASSAGGSASAAQSVLQLADAAGINTDTSFCGTKPITLGIEDGVGLNQWSKVSMAIVRSEAAKCSNVKVRVAIGQGNLQKAISDINGLTAQGIDALVVIPDFGQSELPAIKAATNAGVKVVAWAADPGGTAGTDYVAYVDWSTRAAGEAYATWIAKDLGQKGNVLYIGGPAGNPVSQGTLAGLTDGLSKYPNMKVLHGNSEWPVTTWDPSSMQQVTSQLLSQYPTIDAVVTDDSLGTVGTLNAFKNANRAIPAIATLDSNTFACTLAQVATKAQAVTISERNWLGRIAARKAIAAAEGLSNNEPSSYDLPFFEDTQNGKPLKCDSAQPPNTFFSNKLSAADLAKYGTFSN